MYKTPDFKIEMQDTIVRNTPTNKNNYIKATLMKSKNLYYNKFK